MVVFFLILPRQPRSTLFPYTTLFRSRRWRRPAASRSITASRPAPRSSRRRSTRGRSEEHTSELQSRPHLVCRLLLEKKNSLIQLFILQFALTTSRLLYSAMC